ncbi:hypothetical protein JF544_16320 [Halobacillus kuroshimensis]|uniref:Uncharacterized protein n=1 Tax=Halobacillus kuroshimensis TaxID=302481 RepID=A0ABS3DZQ0_9BACI|nr:hypothetical protein [Halobacillus kuroshimensis]MBN8236825.1 hypothetical protein [Halobacillus kuroshimensis]
MLRVIKDNQAKVKCVNCGTVTNHDVAGLEVPFLEEFSEYENVVLGCTCGTMEVFNVNIPIDAEDENFETGELPLEEEIQRYYVRILQRLVRPDLRGSGKV